MAIKITKPGQTEFHGFCDRCGCEFTYELIDLKLSAVGNKVNCPTCGKDYLHPTMIQAPTLRTGIGYQWPSDSTDPCAGCEWLNNLKQNGLYVGDTPCTWCNKGRVINLTGIDTCTSTKDYTTPCVNQLDAYLTKAQQNVYDAAGVSGTITNVKPADNVVNGTVMNTILECCHNCTKDLNICGDTESKSCSSEHKCEGNKNCKCEH